MSNITTAYCSLLLVPHNLYLETADVYRVYKLRIYCSMWNTCPLPNTDIFWDWRLSTLKLTTCTLCFEPITRPEESYQLLSVTVFGLEISAKRRPWPALGCCAKEEGGEKEEEEGEKRLVYYRGHSVTLTNLNFDTA